jgi:hypothetical protein
MYYLIVITFEVVDSEDEKQRRGFTMNKKQERNPKDTAATLKERIDAAIEESADANPHRFLFREMEKAMSQLGSTADSQATALKFGECYQPDWEIEFGHELRWRSYRLGRIYRAYAAGATRLSEIEPTLKHNYDLDDNNKNYLASFRRGAFQLSKLSPDRELFIKVGQITDSVQGGLYLVAANSELDGPGNDIWILPGQNRVNTYYPLFCDPKKPFAIDQLKAVRDKAPRYIEAYKENICDDQFDTTHSPISSVEDFARTDSSRKMFELVEEMGFMPGSPQFWARESLKVGADRIINGNACGYIFEL